MNTRWLRRIPLVSVLFLSACGMLRGCGTQASLTPEQVKAAYSDPLPAPDAGLRVFHLGHSLVGRDMPAMLAQLAGASHSHNSQLGWGTPLKAHWEPSEEIFGFETENDHPAYRDAKEALTSGAYDAVVFTEMVEIKDAIKYHGSPEYLNRWADLARKGNPNARLYLYETWHNTDDPAGWLTRIDQDLKIQWEDEVLLPAMARMKTTQPIYVIPGGQVMARFVREVESRGGVDNIADRYGLFAQKDDGTPETIHVNDLGAYLTALTHYAVLYHANPVGLPFELQRADGTKAEAPGPEAARLMQDVVWQVVTNYPKTGVTQAP